MPVFETSRKVQEFGSSLACTLPALFTKACEIEKGNTINVLYELNGVLVISKSSDCRLIIESLNNILNKIKSNNEVLKNFEGTT